MRKINEWMGIRAWGRHSLVLIVAGLVYVGVGIAYLSTKPSADRREALYYADTWMPLQHWGYVFILVGCLAIVSARWPTFSVAWGYTVLTGLSSGWSAFYLAGILFHHTHRSNFTGFATWALIAFLWWAISGLVNPNSKRAVRK